MAAILSRPQCVSCERVFAIHTVTIWTASYFYGPYLIVRFQIHLPPNWSFILSLCACATSRDVIIDAISCQGRFTRPIRWRLKGWFFCCQVHWRKLFKPFMWWTVSRKYGIHISVLILFINVETPKSFEVHTQWWYWATYTASSYHGASSKTSTAAQLPFDNLQFSQEICTRFCCALLCCGYAIVHNEFTWSIYPYSSRLLCWHWGNR